MRTRGTRRTGQGMTEYVVVVALVAIGTIGIVGFFGDNLRELFSDSAQAVAGNDSVANSASQVPNSTYKDLSNFGDQASNGGHFHKHP